MDRLSLGHWKWLLHRAHLRHGVLLWVFVALGGAIVAGSMVVAEDGWQLVRLRHELTAARSSHSPAANRVDASSKPGRAWLPLPGIEERFSINAAVLDIMAKSRLQPDKIRFKFDRAGDAAIVRQTMTFSIKARWGDIAHLLKELQASHRAIYIAGLHIERDAADMGVVLAKVRLAVAFDAASAQGGRK